MGRSHIHSGIAGIVAVAAVLRIVGGYIGGVWRDLGMYGRLEKLWFFARREYKDGLVEAPIGDLLIELLQVSEMWI